jgi:hypothetical protein
VRRRLYENGLSLFFLSLFLGSLVGQAIAGQDAYNNDEIDHAALLDEEPETLSLRRYVTSSHFGQAVMENWQSEYLQFSIFVLATVWLVQKGSTESKPLDQAGPDSDPYEPVGVRGWLRANSLLLVMGTIFFASWFAQSVTGWSTHNAEQIDRRRRRATSYSTVTVFARLRGWSTLRLRRRAMR